MGRKLILLVEDNGQVQNFNARLLAGQGFDVEAAMTLAAARSCTARCRPDAIVLDIGMPDGNGLDFLRELRKVSKTPVLLLTGYGKNEDVIAGFESGCSDYLTKPYTFGILMARLNNLLQGAEQVPETVTKGPLKMLMIPMTALLDDKDLLLSQKDFSLLLFFIQREGRIMSPEYLYEKVWGKAMIGDNQAVKTAVSRLRSKLTDSGYSISYQRGEGYFFGKVI